MSLQDFTDYSLPKNAYLTFDASSLKTLIIDRLNENETFIIGVGKEEIQEVITFNPKTCVVCLENKCEIRGSCKHATLCSSCYEKFKINTSIVKCPICRETYLYDKVSQCIKTYVN